MTQKTAREALIGLYQKGSLDGLKGICLPDKPVGDALKELAGLVDEEEIYKLIKERIPIYLFYGGHKLKWWHKDKPAITKEILQPIATAISEFLQEKINGKTGEK